MSRVVLVLLSLFLLVGCSRKNEANAKNFEQTIGKRLAGTKLCTPVAVMSDQQSDAFLANFARGSPRKSQIAETVRRNASAGKSKLLATAVLRPADEKSEAAQLFYALAGGDLVYMLAPV